MTAETADNCRWPGVRWACVEFPRRAARESPPDAHPHRVPLRGERPA